MDSIEGKRKKIQIINSFMMISNSVKTCVEPKREKNVIKIKLDIVEHKID